MKKSKVIQRSLTVVLLLFLCLNLSPTHSDAASSASQQKQISSVPDTSTADAPIAPPIGPVTDLPGSTIFRSTHPDTSLIGKSGGLTLTITGIELGKYTSVYWGPAGLDAIQHALSGTLTPDRILVYDPAMSSLPSGAGFWLGSSPNIYQAGDIGTHFRLLTQPLVLASDVGISNTDIVMPVMGTGFQANLLFETNYSGTSYAPSNNYFDSWQFKSGSLSGSILSSFSEAFWYTAPDVEIQIQPSATTFCLNSLTQITVTATNQGPGSAAQILVTGVLPAGWEFVSYIASPCGLTECYDPATGIWTVGELAGGNASTLTLTVKVVAPGQATLSESKTQYQVDPVADNDTASEVFDTSYCSFLPLID
jgi:hypothetical protein